jgi:hypothetical protein
MHILQATFLQRFATLRDAEFSAELTRGAGIHGDLHCDIDEDQGGTTFSLRSRPGILAEIEALHTGQPRWLVLRLELGEGHVIPGDVLGVTMRGSVGTNGLTMGVYLRRVHDGAMADTKFDEDLLLTPRSEVVTALHTLSAHDNAIGDPAQFALVLGLPLSPCRIELEDLGFFILPAAMGLRSKPLDFAAFAV